MASISIMSYPARDSFSGGYPQQLRPTSPTSSQPYRKPEPLERSPHQQSQISAPAPAPAPRGSPEQEARPFLPSISKLLGIADAQRPVHDHAHETHYRDSRRVLAPPYDSSQYSQNDQSAVSTSPTSHAPYKRRWDGSDVSSHSYEHPRAMESRPRQPEHGYDQAHPQSRGYIGSPSAASDGSYYSPTSTMSVQPGMHPGQVPSAYAPATLPGASQSTPNLPGSSSWEHHHHYIGQPTSQGMYPPLPDRYICPTCNKAFSRPSSLKIHSHSHTGEKPFKCPHAGCGKAFSVKSNMKRHEKGCHRAQDQAHAGASTDTA